MPNLMFESLFKALRTGVLEIHECFEMDFFSVYDWLEPTKDSVDRFNSLLFKEPSDAFKPVSEGPAPNTSEIVMSKADGATKTPENASLEKKTSAGPRHRLIAFAMKRIGEHSSLMSEFPVAYAFFKIALYGSLSKCEYEGLKAISSKAQTQSIVSYTGELIDQLYKIEKHGDLFAVLADNWNTFEMIRILSKLQRENPRILAEIIKVYAEGCRSRKCICIPEGLVLALNTECQYYLATIDGCFGPCRNERDWNRSYFMSRFSALPSERLQACCLREASKCSIWEEVVVQGGEKTVQEGGDCSATKLVRFDVGMLPKELQFHILEHFDLLSQIYMVPRVCALWKDLHRNVLNGSQTAQKALERDLDNRDNFARILSLKRCPWDRFFESQLDALEYLLHKCNLEIDTFQDAYKEIKSVWRRVGTELGRTRPQISQASYLDLYVRCCKSDGTSLVLYQLPGMSDRDYAELLRRVVDQHGIIPIIPSNLLEDDCQRFVDMLADDANLVAQLLQDVEYGHEKLVAYLFSTKSPIPPAIASVLAEKSSLYKYLFGGNNNVGEYMDFIFGKREELLGTYKALAHDVVNLCLLLGTKYDAETLESFKKGVHQSYQHMYYPSPYSDSDVHEFNKYLGSDIMQFLLEHRACFSTEEVGAIERFLDQSEMWDVDDGKSVFNNCNRVFVNDCRLVTNLIY